MPLPRLLALAGALLLAVLLSGCMLISDTNLLPTDDAIAIVDGDIVITGYDVDAQGVQVLSDGEPGVYPSGVGNSYGGPDGDTTIYFLPYDAERHVIVMLGAGGVSYGLARLEDGILEIRLLIHGEPNAVVANIGPNVPAGLAIGDRGIEIPDRDALDTMLGYFADGTIPTVPLVFWIGNGEAPARLTPEAGWYVPAG